MIAVTDTSPILYLLLIGEIDLLPKLFGELLAPPTVIDELRHPSSPAPVAEWLAQKPGWLRIEKASPAPAMPPLDILDRGEREAIQLARQHGADLVILDDKAGRLAARELGLRITGTLGVLEAAARRDLVDLRAAVGRLRRTNFRASPALLATVLRRNR